MVVAPLPEMEAGVKEHLASAGRPEQAKLTAVVKPGDAVRTNVVVPGNPSVTPMLASEVGRQKSAVLIVKVAAGGLLRLKLWSPEYLAPIACEPAVREQGGKPFGVPVFAWLLSM